MGCYKGEHRKRNLFFLRDSASEQAEKEVRSKLVCLSVPEFCLVNISVKRVFPNECYFFLPNLLQSHLGRFILNSAFIILTTTYLQYHNVMKMKVRNRYVCPPPYSAQH